MILLVFPPKALRHKYKEPGYATINKNGFKLLDQSHSWGKMNFDELSDHGIDSKLALKLIKDRIEIWHRWVSNADQYELLIREALLFSIGLALLLKNNNIKVAIFHTSVSHHLDSIIIEVACHICGIKPIFLYAFNIDSRLIPIYQAQEFPDNTFVNEKISDYSSRKAIEKFISNKKLADSTLKGNFHSFQVPISKIRTNFIAAFFYILIIATKRSLSFRKEFDEPFSLFPSYTIINHLRCIERQRKSLRFYSANCISENGINTFKEMSERVILIAAHYQPEASSFPEGWDYSNHVDIILELRKKGYKGPILYKEHPASRSYFESVVGMSRVGIYRSKKYYENLLKLGCIFLPDDFQLSLEDDWYIPATITGTIAQERALVGKKTIIFGYPWFKDCPNVINIKNYSSHLINKKNHLGDGNGEKAIQYYESILSFKTLKNSLGIATGAKISDVLEVEFLDEYEELLTKLNLIS